MGIPITSIKEMCSAIIKAYTFHVRDKVKEGRQEYIETGIDEDIDKYKEVFLTVLSYTLGVGEVLEGSDVFLNESKEVLDRVLCNKGYACILTKYKLMIYTTCDVMFEKVIEGLGYYESK